MAARIVALAVLLLPATSGAQADGPASAVAEARAEFNEAFARGDVATIATLLGSDESVETGPAKWPVVSERGTWIERWVEDGRQNVLEGTYQAMWRLQEGRWRLAAHLMVPARCAGPYCQQ